MNNNDNERRWYRVTGGYQLGPDGVYFLSEQALNHITIGDIAERLLELNGRRTGINESVIAGGLHTANGWEAFKSKRSDTIHLRFYNSSEHKEWYYARELSNGVITLKIPKSFFQSGAAKITAFPEAYYKSGYLWKTLFSKNWSNEQIIDAIDEALRNLNIEEREQKIKIGYAKTSHPLTAIRIQIQCTGNNINSAFPSWGQPFIGNIGKPYSHFDSTNLSIAAPTEYFSDFGNFSIPPKSIVATPSNIIGSVFKNTPAIFKRRTFNLVLSINERREQRYQELREICGTLNARQIDEISNYVTDIFITRESGELFHSIPAENYNVIRRNLHFFNCISFIDNIIESLTILSICDENNGATAWINAIKPVLLNRIKFAIFIDAWNNKRLHTSIAKLVSSYYKPEIISTYIELINLCPSRNDLFVEFDLMRYWKRELDLTKEENKILLSIQYKQDCEVKITDEILLDYAIRNMHENYLGFLPEAERIEYIGKILDQCNKPGNRAIEDIVFFNILQRFSIFS